MFDLPSPRHISTLRIPAVNRATGECSQMPHSGPWRCHRDQPPSGVRPFGLPHSGSSSASLRSAGRAPAPSRAWLWPWICAGLCDARMRLPDEKTPPTPLKPQSGSDRRQNPHPGRIAGAVYGSLSVAALTGRQSQALCSFAHPMRHPFQPGDRVFDDRQQATEGQSDDCRTRTGLRAPESPMVDGKRVSQRSEILPGRAGNEGQREPRAS